MHFRTMSWRPIGARRLTVVIAIAAIFVATGLFTLRDSRPRHPQFGAVYQTVAFDQDAVLADPVGGFLRKHLPMRVVLSAYFPSRYRGEPKCLDLKGAQLEWSVGGSNTGWLYFQNAAAKRTARWEFAPCSETNLLDVGRIPKVFCGPSDSRRIELFGSTSTTRAIQVALGQILFARRTDGGDRIYVLKLKAQAENKLYVDYCVISPRPGSAL